MQVCLMSSVLPSVDYCHSLHTIILYQLITHRDLLIPWWWPSWLMKQVWQWWWDCIIEWFCFFACLAPVIAPGNFTYTGVTATSIAFEWDRLTEQGVNGMVTSYTINCEPGSIMVSPTRSKNNIMIVITSVITVLYAM